MYSHNLPPSVDDDPLDVDAIIEHYDTFRAEWVKLRQRHKADDARRLVEKFDQAQCLRADVAAKKADPNDTRAFLVLLAAQLRDGREVPHAVREYLSDALIEAAKHPATATSAFGLARAKHRPISTSYRDGMIAFRVAELATSMPINTAGRDGSAIETAAREFRVSEAVAERAWKQHGAFVKAWLAAGEETPAS